MSWKDNVSKMSKIKNWDGKLYKVLQGNRSFHNNFEWSLPEGNKPGDWTPVIENVKMCERGYHLTTYYAHWSDTDVSIYEAEGNVVEFDGFDKVVCSRARLLRLVENPFPKNNSGNYNSGIMNSGCNNSGNENSGDYNSGNRNSGNYNTGCNNSGCFNPGDLNSGDWNSGDWNSGCFNSGNKNSGYKNFGDYNSGSCNIGNRNSGCFNSGRLNSGDYNLGNNNSGNFNIGDRNTGYFCIGSPSIIIFGKPAPKNWIPEFPGWMFFSYTKNNSSLEEYHASWQKAFEDADKKGIEELLVLPNFDYEIFEKISSITKKQIEEKLGE